MANPRSAAVYCRISQDRLGTQLGVRRQEEDCRALADRKGWRVAEVYVDDDVSAYSGKPRPAYRRLLVDLASGSRDAVLVYDLDRLHRQPRELEEFFGVCDQAAVRDLASVAGDVNLSTDEGRFHARIMGAVAAKESADKSRRIRRQRDQMASEGRPNGGRRPYGYEPGGLVVREAEAQRVREAARRVLAGESLRTVARSWNATGAPSASGSEWTVSGLRSVLSGPRIAGLRVHRGEVVGDAAWPALVDRETHERLVALLGDRRRQGKGRPPTNLLTAMLVCGRCGANLSSSRRLDGARRYACHPSPGGAKGCGRIAVAAEPVEAVVSEAVLSALSGPGLEDALRAASGEDAERAELIASLQADEARLDELATLYADGQLDARSWSVARERLQTRAEDTRKALQRRPGLGVLGSLPTGDSALRAAWDAESVEWRRAVIAAVLDHVVVGPGRQGPRTFDPSRLDLVWRV